jgi:hypothetical protein
MPKQQPSGFKPDRQPLSGTFPVKELWCPRRDSNSQSRRRRFLRPVRIRSATGTCWSGARQLNSASRFCGPSPNRLACATQKEIWCVWMDSNHHVPGGRRGYNPLPSAIQLQTHMSKNSRVKTQKPLSLSTGGFWKTENRLELQSSLKSSQSRGAQQIAEARRTCIG